MISDEFSGVSDEFLISFFWALMSFWLVFGDFLLFYYDRGFSSDEFLMSFWGHFGRSILG